MKVFSDCNIVLSDYQISQFERLTAFMLNCNKTLNLTRITAENEILEKHYLDSVLPLTLVDVPRGTICLDIGSGAGFPGFPMKIYRPDLEMTLLESARKKTDYLTSAAEETGADCRVVNGRSEELSHEPLYRGKFGLVIARALANLPALCEYGLALVERGGLFLAMKGGNLKNEVGESVNALRLMGGAIERVADYRLPAGDKRKLVVVRKISQTPLNYPRKRVNITKNPL